MDFFQIFTKGFSLTKLLCVWFNMENNTKSTTDLTFVILLYLVSISELWKHVLQSSGVRFQPALNTSLVTLPLQTPPSARANPHYSFITMVFVLKFIYWLWFAKRFSIFVVCAEITQWFVLFISFSQGESNTKIQKLIKLKWSVS